MAPVLAPQVPMQCPACAKDRCVAGSILASDEGGQFRGAFYPDGLRFFAFKRMVRLKAKQRFHACPDCGILWSQVVPSELEALLAKNEKRANSPTRFVWGLPQRMKVALLVMVLFMVIGGVISIAKLIAP